ncbi:MAG: hypothetical protein ACXVCY_11755 [Pseudobdellovibrionaceae bacterium]
MKLLFRIALCLSLLFTCACSTQQLIRNSEYKYSEAAFKSGDVAKALEDFPKKEKHGFVTSIEKSWLGFWNDDKNHSDLMTQAKTLDERKYTSILRETQYFFYNESEDGYIPAEHEIILMHLLNSMFFMRNQQWEDARVEARKATFFLQNYFKEDQSHFDDPALRLWLASLWLALGEWQEAQVDFRKIFELTKEPSFQQLAEMTKPPSNLNLIFDGNGPQVIWDEGNPTPHFLDASSPPKNQIHITTLPWFLRHEQRNSQIRDVVMKSHYMAQYYGLNTSVGAEKSFGFVASNSVRVAGIIAGAVIIGGGAYLLIQSGTTSSGSEAMGYIIAGGALVFKELWSQGNQIARKFDESTKERKQEGLEQLRTYRFVRFLPSWISISVNKEEQTGFTEKTIPLQAPSAKTKLLLIQRF